MRAVVKDPIQGSPDPRTGQGAARFKFFLRTGEGDGNIGVLRGMRGMNGVNFEATAKLYVAVILVEGSLNGMERTLCWNGRKRLWEDDRFKSESSHDRGHGST